MEKKGLKFAAKVLMIFCIIAVVSGTIAGCMLESKKLINNVNFLEGALEPIENLEDYEIEKMKASVDKYLHDENGNRWFVEMNFGDENAYIAYFLYYDYLFLKMLGEDVSGYSEFIKLIDLAAVEAVDVGNINCLDLLSLICLEHEITGTCTEKLLIYFYDNHYDDVNGLFYKSVDDDVDAKISFSVDVYKMFERSNVEFDFSKLKKYIKKYYDSYELLLPESNGNIFLSGGEAIYAMRTVGNDLELNYEIVKWYEKWECVFNPVSIETWDDVLMYKFIFLPVADAFETNTGIKNSISTFVTDEEKIYDFINNHYEDRYAFDIFEEYIYQLSEDEKDVLGNAVNRNVTKYLKKLSEMSIENCYYGLVLMNSLQHEEHSVYTNIIRNVNNYYQDKYLDWNYEETAVNVAEVIEDTYFYIQICWMDNEAMLTDNQKQYIGKAKEIWENNYQEIMDPKVISKMLACYSHLEMSIPKKIYTYVERLLGNYCNNEEILNSYYIVFLFYINDALQSEYIEDDEFVKKANTLCNEGIYYEIKGEEILSLEATFYFYALDSLYDVIGIQFNDKKCTQKIKEMFADESGYLYYESSNMSDLKSLYWGLALTH